MKLSVKRQTWRDMMTINDFYISSVVRDTAAWFFEFDSFFCDPFEMSAGFASFFILYGKSRFSQKVPF